MRKYTKQKNNSTPKEKALEVFKYASEYIPAYKKLLQKYKINPRKIIKTKDFDSVPVTEKDNYLRAFRPFDLVPKGKFPPMVSASSGSSGKPYYWPRGDEQEKWGGQIHRIIIEDIFKLRKKRTLAIVCFSMGNWIAGTFTLASLREVTRTNKQFQLTAITPGMDKDDAITTLRDFAPLLESIILIGYPPFLMDVVLGAKELGINLKKLDLHFILAGENFSEKWRSMLLKVSAIPHELNRAISIYGTADAGSIGHENPFTIMLRKLASKHKEFKRELFGEMTFMPTVVAYYPEHTFFELINRELIFTTQSGIPLVRYNIKDHGLLLSNRHVLYLLKKHKLNKGLSKNLMKWKNPLIVLKGRNDVSVTFYALNIYPENIKAGLEDGKVVSLVTGKYIARTEQSKDFREQTLYIEVELKLNVAPTEKIKKVISDALFKHLIELNSEYRKLFNSIHEKALPEIILIKNGHEQFIIKKAKHRWIKK
jgi:phenylacetate-CoA ligase